MRDVWVREPVRFKSQGLDFYVVLTDRAADGLGTTAQTLGARESCQAQTEASTKDGTRSQELVPASHPP